MRDTVILDLDGTLLDTLEDLWVSTNYALERMKLPQISIAQVRDGVGNGAARLMHYAVGENKSEETVQQSLVYFREHYYANCSGKTKPYDGIYDALKRLKALGCKMAIVSNKPCTAVETLNRKFFGEYIDVALGQSDDMKKKPAPDMVFAALNKLGSTAENALYIGDSEVDIKTAHNAGMPCVSVTWGFRDKDVLEANGAEYIADTPEEMTDFILKL